MVQENRQIMFSSEELTSAFASYARTTPDFMPNGKILASQPVDQDGVKLTIATQYGDSTRDVEFTYRGVDVLRPLIMFCIENNIMLPREGHKSFSNIDGCAVVTITLILNVEFSTLAPPMTGEHVKFIASNEHPAKSMLHTPTAIVNAP